MIDQGEEIMKAYVLKIAGTMLLLSAAEALLPAGNMRGAAKRVFALIRLAILMEPVVSLVSGAARL